MKKILAVLNALLLAVIVLPGGTAQIQADGEDFDEFLTEEWKEMMESDYSTMHFSVKDYRSMGIEKPEISLGEVSYETFEKERENAQESLDKLHSYDYDSLNDRQQHDYIVYERSLEETIELSKYPQFMEMFNPYNGTLSNLIPNFTEFVFYTEEDIDDYLVLLADFPRFMNDMMEFTRRQASEGYFMRDAALDEQLTEMDDFVAKGEENPLIVIFENNVDAFEGLSDEQRAAYKEQNRDIVLNQILPAYQKTRDDLDGLRGSRSVSGSLYEYSEGAEYFKALTRAKSSSDLSPQEVFDYLNKAVTDSTNYMMNLMFANPESLSDNENMGIKQITELKTPQEILDYLQSHLEDFPKGPEVKYTPSYLDPSVATPSVLAYYVQTPIDDVTDNVVRINGTSLSDDDVNTLYYTLAHEGFPGHLYQFTWYYSQDYNPLRHDISMIGYSEGWAQYVEKVMLDRAPLDHFSAEMTAVNTFLSYCLQAAADVAVNGLGYDEAKLTSYFKDSGFSEEAAHDVYEYCIDMPGTIIPYGFGLAKFWELRERTEQGFGSDFDLEDFHLQLLTNGMRPFELVESDLAKYAESKGKTLPSEFTFFGSEMQEDAKGAGIFQFLNKYGTAVVIGVLVVILLIIGLVVWGLIKLLKKLFGKK